MGQSNTGDPSCTVIPTQNGNLSQQRQFVEQFSYNQIGQLGTKRLKEKFVDESEAPSLRYWDMTFTYNGASENLLGSIRYPDTKSASGTLLQNGYTVTYTYDLMGRQTGMTYDTSPSDGVGMWR